MDKRILVLLICIVVIVSLSTTAAFSAKFINSLEVKGEVTADTYRGVGSLLTGIEPNMGLLARPIAVKDGPMDVLIQMSNTSGGTVTASAFVEYSDK